jgi:hypothetical protein
VLELDNLFDNKILWYYRRTLLLVEETTFGRACVTKGLRNVVRGIIPMTSTTSLSNWHHIECTIIIIIIIINLVTSKVFF